MKNVAAYKKYLLSMSVLLIAVGLFPVHAQEGGGMRLLTDSINPDSGMVTIFWLDLDSQVLTPVTSFNEASYCLPEIMPDQNLLLYEPAIPGQTPYVYQIDLANGGILPVPGTEAGGLQCPAVNPNGTSIAWLKAGESTRQLIVTGADGSNPTVFSEYPDIYDVLWSPDGQILIYTATEDDETFRTLYSHNQAKTSFWGRDQGLIVDYSWLPDSSALLVAYYTQETAVIGRLSRECVLTGNCIPIPLAMFGLESNVVLSEAFSPDGTQLLMVEEIPGGDGSLRSDLYSVNVQDGGAVRLTNTPDLIKTSPIWTADNTVYFVGSLFDSNSFKFVRNAIYELPSGGSARIAYQSDGYFPAQIIGWEE